MSDFHFLRPECFYLLVPLAIVWAFRLRKQNQSDWQQWIPEHLSATLFSGKQKNASKVLPIGLAIAWLFSVIALAGPTWQKIEKPVFKSQTANIIVMDMSLSMRSTDIKPDRLTKAKFKAIDLATSLKDSDVGLVAYAGDAFTISPLTQDARNITALIPSLSPEIMPIPGSYPLIGLEKAQSLMQQAGYLSGQIYWITDGVEYEDITELKRFMRASPFNINILSVGTQAGAPIKMKDGSLLKDNSGNIVMPKVNESALDDLASLSGGIYQPVTANDMDIERLSSQLQTSSKQDAPNNQTESDLTGDDWQEFGPYVVLLLLPICLFAFRKGATIALLLPVIFVLSVAAPAPALAHAAHTSKAAALPDTHSVSGDNQTPSTFSNIVNAMFKTNDQLASEAYRANDFGGAQQQFEDPQWRATSAYKAGDYETALKLFEEDTSAQGLYNQGNALAQLGQLDQAIEAYNKALKAQPNLEDAKINKDFATKLKEELQSNSENSNESEGEADPNQSQDNDQQGEQQKNQQNDQQNDQQKNEQNGQQNQQEQNQNDSETNGSNDQKQDQQSSEQQNQPSDSPSQQKSNENGKQQGEAQEQQSELNEANKDSIDEASDSTENTGQKQTTQLTPEQIAEKEQQQKIKQLLRKVDDDPSVLLRNKMILESRRRQQERRRATGVTKSW
ncbi:vWA domain-containing protein [Psychrosphaera haliotis]|uniref:VWA domain-containing protein n=1 Tax=Psychrosphaera haliotis TaxID=555083 RepID=A0A6N8F801_9GAMM|nr:VWA domain-containing protein [Psychrosphaera haliotis]MUH72304.1 VWA domain-containing protein [Psychrosphaera haliotis]